MRWSTGAGTRPPTGSIAKRYARECNWKRVCDPHQDPDGSHFPHTRPDSLAAESATARRRLATLGLSTRGTSCALTTFMSDKRIVYVIRSRKDPERHYVGLTSDLPSRLASHNAGASPQTRTLIPWALVVSVQFASADAAIRFERFLKSSSGRAFAKHYFE